MSDDWTEESRWTELRIQDDGISVALYEQADDGEPSVVDETWFTDAEIEEMRNDPEADGLVVLDG